MDAVVDCPTPAGSLRVRIARRFTSRALGLLALAPLAPDEALLIAPCSSIHTIGMRYPIDVIFLDRAGRVLRVAPDVRAQRARFGFGARAVLEARSGVAALQGLAPGVRLTGLAAALAP